MLKLLEEGGILRRDKALPSAQKGCESRRPGKTDERCRQEAGHEREALERMGILRPERLCRWKVLLECFDEEVEWNHCGHCDNCINPPENALPAHPVQRWDKTERMTSGAD